ncbi:MAG TPA: TonB-dependent receptor [Allosphingosinicella sp.]|nr:TonB-dependent receptor [Allosphingosinicella sp.]
MHRNTICSLFAGSTAALVWAVPAHAQLADEIQLSLPAQDLSASLREVSLRTGRNIVAPAELVRGREAPAVSGPFTAEGAVRILLAGSGLDVRRVGDSFVIFQPHAGTAPPPGAAAGGSSAPAEATIVVTGTNIRGGQPTSPVIVLGREEIDKSGVTSVEQLMRTVPQNSQSGVNQENFLVVGAGADSTEHGAGINLRGLGQRATLVLVNGRRVAPSGGGSFVDVSLIPLSAIERVEILTDGASAIYGSDAVGGVVNFILRPGFEGVETLVQAGTSTRGGGDQLLAGVTGGARWAGGHAMLSYEYRREDAVLARDRAFTINISPNTTIFPRERRHSLFGLVDQQLAPGLDLNLAGSFAHRDTTRTYFLSGTSVPVGADAHAETGSLTGTLSYHVGDNWLIKASTGWSRSTTAERQSQPGGEELINRFDSRSETFDYGLQADGSLFRLPAGEVRLAVGAEGRHETHYDVFETQTSPAREKRAHRDVRSVYGELQVPLVSGLNRRPGLERLTLTGAVRYEHYDAFGGSWNPRVGMLWSPVRGLTFRAAYGTSFRAPLLSEMGGLYNVFYFPTALLTATGPAPAGIALATGGTNPDIGPERSRSWTAGVELEPRFAPGLSLRANYYSIRFSDRIALPAPSIVVIGNPAFEPILNRSPSLAQVQALIAGAGRVFDLSGPNFTSGGARPQDVTIIVDNRFGNTAVTTTRGIDLLLSYPFAVGRNRFVADLNANYILSFDDRLTATSAVISALNRPFRPVDLRVRGGLSWSRNGWGANVAVDYTDSYRDDRRAVVRPVGAFTTVDLGVSYAFGNGEGERAHPLRIALTVTNLFDRDPPFLLPDTTTTAGLGYDPVNANGRGRAVSLQLRKKW